MFYVSGTLKEDVAFVVDHVLSIMPLYDPGTMLLLFDSLRIPNAGCGYVSQKLLRVVSGGTLLVYCSHTEMNLPANVQARVKTIIIPQGTNISSYQTDVFTSMFDGDASPLQTLLHAIGPQDAIVLDTTAFAAGKQFVFRLLPDPGFDSTCPNKTTHINVTPKRPDRRRVPQRSLLATAFRVTIFAGLLYAAFRRFRRR